MSSSAAARLGGHLENREGDEIVFCHNPDCGHEWYRSDHQTLDCPHCGGEITEILHSRAYLKAQINPENDPRHDIALPSFLGQGSPPPLFPGHSHDHYDSDPEEEDIERHLGRDGFFARRTGRGPSLSRRRGDLSDPNDADAVMRHFHDMLVNDFRVPPRPDGDDPSSRSPLPNIRTTTLRGPFGGTTTFTIATGPISPAGPAQFNAVFGELMGGLGAPDARNAAGPGGPGGPRVPPVGLAAGITEILQQLLNPAAAVRGDAVYSQEALDQIITTLMEANPQSNAAPPASQAALEKLQKKVLDDEMLGTDGKAECTICIDEIYKGDEVLVLPCRHWFHGECVTLWLKEHNTCPVCRTPIENRNGRGSTGNDNNRNDSAGTTDPRNNTASPGTASQPQERERTVRSPSENMARLNTLRTLAGLGNTSDRDDHTGNRRNSLSPQTTRTQSGSEFASRFRDRSPSLSRDRNRQSSFMGRPRGNSGGSGSAQSDTSRNPLSWLRNTFTRNRDSQDGGDQRRP